MDLPAFLTPALVAYLFLALAGLIDKVLLQTSIVSPRAYAFYVGILSVAAVVLLPFGVVNIPDRRILLAALVSGVAGVYALWSFYNALKEYEASRVITSTGALIPVFTLILSVIFLNEFLGFFQLLGFFILLLGGAAVSLRENVRKTFTFELFNHAAVAAALFAVSFSLMRFVFLAEPFLNGLFWTRIGSVLGALTIIVIPENFRRIYWATKKVPRAAPVPFLFNQGLGGLGGFLQNYAISLGSAALVGAIQGVQYAFLFVLSITLVRYFPQLKETTTPRQKVGKALAIVAIGFGLYFMTIR
jgi:drug/metabolite transporter (DMT)-like permease